MIDLQSLEAAMTDISRVGHYEHQFEINGKLYAFWPLTADQDREVFEYAETALEGGDTNKSSQAESIAYMDRFRIAAISQSLVVIGDMDLRNVQEVETGSTLDNGVREKISRYQAVRRFVQQWTKPMIEQFFLQFGEMQNRIEEQARNKVRYTPSDLSAEIDHIGERLAWADDQLKKHENPDPDLSQKIHEHVSKFTDLQNRQRAVVTGKPPSPRATQPQAQEEPEPELEVEEEPPAPPPARPVVERPRAPQAFTAADRPVPRPRPESPLEPLRPTEAPPSRPLVAEAPPSRPPVADRPPERPSQDIDPRFRRVAPPVGRDERPPERPRAPEAQKSDPTPEDYERKFYEDNPDVQPGEDLTRYTPTGDSLIGDDEAASIEAEGRRQALLRRQRIEREMAEQREQEERFQESRQAETRQPGVASPSQVQMTPGGVMVAPGQTIPGRQQRRAPVPAPHREVASVQAAVDQAHAASGARPAGDIRGIPAYELPRQELSPRTKRESAQHRTGKVVVDNPGGGDESLNPRFAGRRRQR